MYMKPSATSNSQASAGSRSSTIASGVALLIMLSSMGCAESSGKTPSNWEYKVEAITASSLSDRLNLLGKQGWELVEATYTDDSGTVQAGYEVILKRVK